MLSVVQGNQLVTHRNGQNCKETCGLCYCCPLIKGTRCLGSDELVY